ncbi:hypothetical protein BHE74_00023401 [Ensete ventricosum]|nr:hypothetical protein BHE74_00023401 [Ensete ventricosum]
MLPALVETGGIGREENRQGGFISREIPTFYSLRLRPLQCPLPFPSPGRLRGCMVAVTRAYALWIGSALPAHRSGSIPLSESMLYLRHKWIFSLMV